MDAANHGIGSNYRINLRTLIRKIYRFGLNQESGIFFRFLFALFLLAAAAIVFIEKDGGQILIHTVPLEITEYRFVNARISRPLNAQSLDKRTAVAVISDRAISRMDAADNAAWFGNLGLVTLTMDSYTQGDRQDWITAGIGKTTVQELIQSAIDFLRGQPFVFDDGVMILFDGFSCGDLLDFHPAVSDTAAVLWLPASAPSESERSSLADRFGNRLTVLPPDASMSEKADFFLEALTRTSHPLYDKTIPNLIAFGSGLLTFIHVISFAAFLTLLPIRHAGKESLPNRRSSKLGQTIIALIIPLVYCAVYAYLPKLLNRPRFLSDTMILIFAIAAIALRGWAQFSGRGSALYPSRGSLPSARFIPAAAWIAVVPTALFILTGNAFRTAGIGLTAIDSRQLYTVLVYLPVLFLFGRAIQEFGINQNGGPLYLSIAATLILIPTAGCLVASHLPLLSVLKISIGALIWILAIKLPAVRDGGEKALFLLALNAASALSSGIMISN